jgi:serine/threonine protein kinase
VTKRSDGSDLVKVLDFGIAKLRGETTSGISTKAGAIIGTLPYMPSEQLRGEKETDHRADVYALGAILYEAIAGRVPHAGSNVQAIMYRILHEDAQDLDTLRPETPHALALVVRKALAREAADRYQTVTELGAALAPFGEHASEPVRTTPFLPPSDTAPTPISVIQEVIEQPAPRQRGRTWTITALLVAALVILAAVWKLRMLDDTKPDPNAQAPGREQELAPPAHERSTIKQPEVPAAGADAKASTSPGSTQPDPSPGPEAPAGRPDGPTDTPDGRKPRKDTPATTKPSKSEPANRPVVIDRKNPYG